MSLNMESPEKYIESLPEERREYFAKLREVIKNNLPEGFEEVMQYEMISYVVPKSIFPAGYHCNPEHPLAFISIGSQKKSHRNLSYGDAYDA